MTDSDIRLNDISILLDKTLIFFPHAFKVRFRCRHINSFKKGFTIFSCTCIIGRSTWNQLIVNRANAWIQSAHVYLIETGVKRTPFFNILFFKLGHNLFFYPSDSIPFSFADLTLTRTQFKFDACKLLE